MKHEIELMDVTAKLTNPDFAGDLRTMLNAAVLREAVNRAAQMIIDGLPAEVLASIAARAGFPGSPTVEMVVEMLPKESIGKASLGEMVQAEFGVGRFEAFRLINLAVGQGLIECRKEGKTFMLGRPGSGGINWSALVKGGSLKSDALNGLQLLGYSRTYAYDILKKAIASKVVGETLRDGKKWVTMKAVKSSPITQPLAPDIDSPPAEVLGLDDAAYPGMDTYRNPSDAEAFCEWYIMHRMVQHGRWDALTVTQRETLKAEWRPPVVKPQPEPVVEVPAQPEPPREPSMKEQIRQNLTPTPAPE